MAITFHDGTGYQLIPVQEEGNKFRGSDDRHNYIIDPWNSGHAQALPLYGSVPRDSRQFIIGTDGEEPIREQVVK